MMRMKGLSRAAGPCVAIVGLLVCAPAVAAQGVGGASAIMRDANGQQIGTATLAESGGSMRVTVTARNLPPGRHGIHLHTAGLCEGPAFTSAGAHFNPTNRMHGLNNPQGSHAGDLAELVAAANGTANYSTTNAMVTLGAGANSLFDADGTALVIHADPDDQTTDPTGNSGGRIACGVVVRGASTLPATGGGIAAVPATAAAASAGLLASLLGLIVRRSTRRRA